METHITYFPSRPENALSVGQHKCQTMERKDTTRWTETSPLHHRPLSPTPGLCGKGHQASSPCPASEERLWAQLVFLSPHAVCTEGPFQFLCVVLSQSPGMAGRLPRGALPRAWGAWWALCRGIHRARGRSWCSAGKTLK